MAQPRCASDQLFLVQGSTNKVKIMDRKQFLATVMALGGSAFLPEVKASVVERMGALLAEAPTKKIDSRKVVFLSDIHICGEFKDGKPKVYPYNPTSLQLCINDILAMRPLPANVVVTGDVAWDYGLEEDYRYAAELLSPLEKAGITVTLGMGNHDRRKAFLKVFPRYAAQIKVEGRIVTHIALPDVDVVMLDSLCELPDLQPRQATTVSGEINAAQIEWLKAFTAQSDRPIILCAHHPIGEMPNLDKFVSDTPSVAGFVYGHTHSWNKIARIMRQRQPLRMVPMVNLPATFYGDIGFAVMTTTPQGAKFEYSSKGFWWPQPMENPPAEWQRRADDLQGEVAHFVF